MGSQRGMKHPFGELIERSSSTIAAQGQISIEDSLAKTTVDKAANIPTSCLSQALAHPALCLAAAGMQKLQIPAGAVVPGAASLHFGQRHPPVLEL